MENPNDLFLKEQREEFRNLVFEEIDKAASITDIRAILDHYRRAQNLHFIAGSTSGRKKNIS